MSHPKTGATALHVAAAKGYIKVMNLVMQAGAIVNIQVIYREKLLLFLSFHTFWNFLLILSYSELNRMINRLR